MSPIRLYKMAINAAVAALARELYHPIRRKDIMPTPSQPIKNRIRFPDEIRIIIIVRKRSK